MEEATLSSPAQPPLSPVRLFSDPEDPCVRRLQVCSADQVGLLFKLCELLTSHGIDICSAEIETKDGLVHNHFELRTARPSDFEDATEWCQELERFLAKVRSLKPSSALDASIAAVSKHLSVNPDLVCVVSFSEIPIHDGPPGELRYSLELKGINQAGLLTYTALVLYRSGFSVVAARITTSEGHISDRFELSTGTPESEHLLRSYLDMPTLPRHKESVPLPFHTTQSEGNLQAIMQMWDPQARLMSPVGSGCSTPLGNSRIGSFQGPLDDAAPIAESAAWEGSQLPRMSSAELDAALMSATRQGSQGDLQLLQARGIASPPRPARMAAESVAESSRVLSMTFPNGDVYNGSVTAFEGGEKRHGLGTYLYSGGTQHQQYKGQWREDRKHGYGVLFYRNGGVYVGQWENNQKKGLGVLLDNQGESDLTAMPSFRYEGQWQDDERQGLGTEESDITPSYFGQFVRGERQGRGVRMSRSKVGIAGCEACYRNGRFVPLLEALEAEMSLGCSSSSSSQVLRDSPGERSPGVIRPGVGAFDSDRGLLARAAEAHREVATGFATLSSGPGGPTANGEQNGNGSGSSNSTNTLTHPSPAGRGAMSPAESVATPMVNVGALGRGRGDRQPPSSGFFPSYDALLSPHEPPPLGRTAQRGPAGGERAAEELSSAKAFGRQEWGGSSGSSSGASAANAAAAAGRTRSRSSPKGSPRGGSSPGSPRQGIAPAGGSVVFSLCEENNLLSPRETTLGSPQPRKAAASAALQPEGGAAAVAGGTASRGLPPLPPLEVRVAQNEQTDVCQEERDAAELELMELNLQRSMSSPTPEGSPREHRDTAFAETSAVSPDTETPPKMVSQSVRPRKVIRTPLLWTEDELAAFITCLGIRPEVAARIRFRKIKGMAHLLEMSNAELRREFGLTSPVERLVVRQSLKRLLADDRWENSVRGPKAGDILSDSVLGRFMVPVEELTLVTKVSQGGYGTVYRGVLNPNVDRAGGTLQAGKTHLVAVKEMKGERTVRINELLKEACVMASLRHTNICTFIGVCADASSRKHYIISELMDCSLFDLIHQPYKLRWHGELTVLKVVDLSKGICAGIVYMHEQNLVHADLKSSNILIDYSSSASLIPRICDFGHAAVRTFPSPHHRIGTPHWAAPEVLRGEALGPAADVYSFGVIIWEMLTQKLPHKGLSFGQVLASVGWAGWTPDLALLPSLPRQLQKLLRECLSFSPSERPPGTLVQQCLRRIPRQARLKALKMLSSFLG